MNPNALTAELRAAAPGLAERLAAILLPLAAVIARAFLRHPRYAALIIPLWTRITRASRRFARAMDRIGTATTPRPARAGRGGGAPPARLPSGHAWLVVTLRHEAAGLASQLRHLLAQPDAAALVAASPQAIRILRPICRMLGITPACVPPLPRRRPVPEAPAPKPTAPKPTAPVPTAPGPGTPTPPHPLLARPAPAAPPPGWTMTPPVMVPPPCEHVRWPWINPFGRDS